MKLPTILLAVSSGLILGVAFTGLLPGVSGLLCFVGFVPLLTVVLGPTQRLRTVVLYLYICFFVYHGITNWWVCSWQENTDPYLMVSGLALWVGHPFFLMLPFLAIQFIRRRINVTTALVSAPLAIAGFEWLHGQTDASYPWLTTGYSLVHTPFAQIADTIGVYGLTLLIATVNVAVVLLIRKLGARKKRIALMLTLGLSVWFVVGIGKQTQYSVDDQLPSVSVMLIQPNMDPWDKWADSESQRLLHQKMVDSAGRNGLKADLVVWSETAIPSLIRDPRNAEAWSDLRTWVDSSQISLLTGYADVYTYKPGEAPPSARASPTDSSLRFDMFNAAMMLNPLLSSVMVHRKTTLTPFAERLPFADQLTFAMAWIEWGVGISAWGKGRTREPLVVVKGADTLARIGTNICIESIYPEVSRDLVNNGADVLCVITNDAWYNGTWGPKQHFDIARMRAIEQRRTVIRCANSGVTGIIYADGSSDALTALPPITRGVAVGKAPIMKEKTVYAIVGDPLPIAGFIITVLLLIIARFPFLLRILPIRITSSEAGIS